MWMHPHDVEFEMTQLLAADGSLHGEMPDVSEDTLLSMYEWMVFARLYDARAVRLQRQGRVGTYAPFSGQEAALIGSSFAVERSDWMFPSYRELPALWVHGVPVEQSLLYTMGHQKGGFVPHDVCAFPPQIIIAAQTLHAMGSAFASVYRNESTVNLCYLGDGATSQGDFHESLNFASVFKLPVVYFVQNNGWAISVPSTRQSASKTLAHKAMAFGMPGAQVDGNDVLAVYQTVKEAVDRARTGGGPSLIEAVTFRQGPHTTSDDPTRYRDAADVQAWIERDPIQRFRRFLLNRNVLTETLDAEYAARANDRIAAAVEVAEGTPQGGLDVTFDAIYATPSRHLQAQKATAVASTMPNEEGRR